MDKELKAKWVAALRSGEYKQGKGRLYDARSNAYCCYGVLRHIADPNDTRGDECSCLKREQLVEYGFPDPFERHVLENMNDGMAEDGCGNGRQYTFHEIADYIEANL